ncbi:NAD(P)H-binding protein [Kineococcus sp. NPDC059986]|uniref:NmrA family NAD(P)-binding protein n=1 Tax=Kineococcus sp. NPDC059986 TaxID=3155538 RepID=UPI00344F2EAE
MIIVTGATGQLGSRVVRSLLDRVPAERIAVSVRDVDAAGDLAARGVRVRAADFTDPDSLAHAFEGAERVLVVSAAIRGPELAARAHRAAIDAARSAGAERVLYTSHQAASPTSQFGPARGHAATEAHLAAGGSHTMLRNGFYATTVPYLLGDALTTGILTAPADGPVSWTGHDDLAEAAALTLLDDDPVDGPTSALTGPEALDLADVARLLTQLTGRPVERVVVDDEQWLADQVAAGVPAGAAEFTLGMFRASRAGEFTVVDPTLAELLGRPATPLRTVLEAAVSAR